MRGALPLTAALLAAAAQAPSPLPTPTPSSFGTDEAIEFMRERWKGDLDEIEKREVRVIRVLTTYSKTGYFLDGIDQKGVNADAFEEFERWINFKRKTTNASRIHVVLIPVSRDELLTGLLEGRGDLASANLTITPERLEQVDFSRPILDEVDEVPVTHKSGPTLKSAEDLSGREVHVRASSSFFQSLKQLNERLKAAGKAPVKIVPADENFETEDLLEMVKAGLLPLTIADSHIASFWSKVLPDLRIAPEAMIRAEGEIGIALRKGSPKLKAAIDEFVRTHREGTAFGNTLLRRYLQKTDFVKNAASLKELKKFQQMIAIFRKYGAQYGFDALMVAAQGYQESRLDQSLKSPRGAVGVMQLLPETAKDMGVPDISRADPNIKAGVKYLRWIYDTQFADAEGMSAIDQGLFCFAAYNAGPGRVGQLRERAGKMGLDPNRWFRNVEIVAARTIGRETVQYVANIYKYYVSYRLVDEQQRRKKPPAKMVGGAGKS